MKLLLVDDDLLVGKSLKLLLRDEFAVMHVTSAEAALEELDAHEYDGAILDIQLGGDVPDGVDLLKTLKQKYPELPVVMASGQREATTVVQCIQLGADDFIEKPVEPTSLKIRLRKAFNDRRRHSVLRRAVESACSANALVGVHPAIANARQLVARAGKMRILFQGETGVGKTPFARYSNEMLAKEDGHLRPFEQVNCAGLSKEQFQDQLFGHKKGAFTGAIADKAGLVAIAKGGDLFLDEVGEMPLDTQALFLTFIDTQEYYRLGDDQKRKADVRILCATNRDLRQMIAEGTFRKDLYSRISQVVVAIPPLRERSDDIPALVDYFVGQFSAGRSKPLSPEVRRRLQEHRWEEGNVRELRDTVEYLCVMGRDAAELGVEHLPDRIGSPVPCAELPAGTSASNPWIPLVAEHGLESSLNAVEKQILEHYVDKCNGVTDDLVRLLKTSKPTLYRRLRQYGIAADPAGARLH